MTRFRREAVCVEDVCWCVAARGQRGQGHAGEALREAYLRRSGDAEAREVLHVVRRAPFDTAPEQYPPRRRGSWAPASAANGCAAGHHPCRGAHASCSRCPAPDGVLQPPKQPEGRNPCALQVDNFSTSAEGAEVFVPRLICKNPTHLYEYILKSTRKHDAAEAEN